MSEFLAPGPPPFDRPADTTLNLRGRLLALAAACIAGGLALAAGLAIHRASLEQRGIEERALSIARASVGAADREIAATTARLEAFATSPALRAGDLRAFYDQIVATPRPEGTSITLFDPERQLLNSQRPFGAPYLPRMTDYNAASQAAVRRVFERREVIVSAVYWAPLARTHVVAVNVPVVVEGVTTHLLAAVLSERRVRAVLEEQRLPASWGSTLLDRNSATIARAGSVEGPGGRETPAEWAPKLRGPDARAVFHAANRDGLPVLVASAHSPASNWTAVVEVPAAFVSAPMQRTLFLLGLGGSLLTAAALAAAVLLARGVERPIKALQAFAASAGERQREAEARYRTYWEHTGEALFVVRVEEGGRFVFEGLNPAHQALTGLSSWEVVGREPSECLPPPVAAAVEGRYRRCVEAGAPLRYAETLQLPAGLRDWETSLAPVRDPASGRIVRLLGSARDITDRRRAETALRDSEERLRLAQEAAGIGTWDWDLATGTVHWSPEVFRITGVEPATPGPHLFAAWLRAVHAEDRPRVEAELAAVAATGGSFRSEYRLFRGDEVRWLAGRGSVVPVGSDAGRRVLGVVMDITAERRAEQALRRLGGRLLTMQDDERRRIARDLHDSTAQLLLAAGFAVSRVRAHASDLPEQADRAVGEALSHIEESQREVRTLAYLLHPPLLDEMGLPAALRWYAKGLAERSGMAIRVEAGSELTEHRLPPAAETAFFRVAQEALANVHRHSGATNVEVRLSARGWGTSGAAVALTVRDDGRGLPGNLAALPEDDNSDGPAFGVGLLGMTERMRQLGGSLAIGPGRPSGTVVEAVVPVAQPDAGATSPPAPAPAEAESLP